MRDARERPQSEALETRRHLDAGRLDTSFSGDGIAAGASGLYIADVAVQSSGKAIVVGSSGVSFMVARYALDGTLDQTFGINGVVTVSFAAYHQTSAAANTVVVQSDDRILIGGWARQLSIANAALVRLDVDGALDTTFDGDGIQEIDDYDGDDADTDVTDIAIQSSGKIVVAGQVEEFTSDVDERWGVARFNSNGSFDTTFDGDGHREFRITDGKDDYVSAVAIDTSAGANNGKIIVTGLQIEDDSHDHIAMARLNTNGSFDSSFDGDGRVLADFAAGSTQSIGKGVVVQPSGKYVIAAIDRSANDTSGLIRFNANGALDTTFGSSGLAHVPLDGDAFMSELLISQSGKLIVGGSFNQQMAISCFTVDGAIDTVFGTNGTRIINPTPNNDLIHGLARTSDGKLYAAGGTGQSQGAVVRLFDRRAATVSVGSFDPVASESGDQASFIVGRVEKLTTPTRVYFGTPGTATPPNTFPVRPRDYDGTGINFGNGQNSLTYVDVTANSTFSSVFLTPVNDSTIEGDEQSAFTILANDAYDIGTPPSTTIVIRDNDFVGGPTVSQAAFNYLTGPQTLTFKFNVDVSPSLTDSDIVLTGPAGIPSHVFTYDAVTDTATLQFNDILPDGNYAAKIVSSGVASATGVPMGSDYTLPFFFLNGDADRDHDVDFDDLVRLAQNYGTTGNFSQGNFDYSADGLIEFEDLVIIAQRYGNHLSVMADPLQVAPLPKPEKKQSGRRGVIDGLID